MSKNIKESIRYKTHDEETINKIAAILGDQYIEHNKVESNYTTDIRGYVGFKSTIGVRILPEGDWLVKYEDDTYDTFSDDKYHELFDTKEAL